MWKSLFRSRKTSASDPPTRAGQASPEHSYDPALIECFKAQHRELLDLMEQAEQAARQRDYSRLQAAMKGFRNVLRAHLMQENIRLYRYLLHCMRDQDDKELMDDMQSEMGLIGRAAMRFCQHYIDFPVGDNSAAKFLEELSQVRAALAGRILREEQDLYGLYLPPSHF